MNRPSNESAGCITGSYKTRSGETFWIVAWDDKGHAPPFEVSAAPDLTEGSRVRLVGNALVRP